MMLVAALTMKLMYLMATVSTYPHEILFRKKTALVSIHHRKRLYSRQYYYLDWYILYTFTSR